MAGIIIGAIMLALGALLAILVPLKIKNKNLEIRFMQTTAISELKGILESNKAAGLEGYRHYVELKGMAASEIPLKAPFSGKDVAYYSADLYQVYEEKKITTDKSGTNQTIKNNEALMTSEKSSEPVIIKEPGSSDDVHIDISQSGIQLDSMQTLNKFEPLANLKDYSYFSNYRYNAMGVRTLGFKLVERTIPIGQQLYALGEARLDNGKIMMGRPLDSKLPFIVSVRDKNDIIKGNKTGANVALVFGILIAIAGILLMIFVK